MDPATQVGGENLSELVPSYNVNAATEDNKLSFHAKTVIALGLAGASLIYALWLATRAPGPLTLSQRIGVVLAIFGYLCWAGARIQLSRSFSVRAKATALVTLGIYSRIRNPVYIFGTIYAAGLILCVGKPIWLLVILVLVPIQVMRAREEARVLEEKFGDAYRTYRAESWF